MLVLPDVNVLIARSDVGHMFHKQVKTWFRRRQDLSLATCAITENGFLRIYGHPNYPGGPGSPAAAARVLSVLRDRPGHRFLTDDFSILAPGIELQSATPSQLTDLYLLALAVRQDAKFVTLDTRIDPARVIGGTAAMVVISA
jgi:toxin-antitoxin system PIN domain toxin